MERPENIAGTINQVDMVTSADRFSARLSCVRLFGGRFLLALGRSFFLWFCHGATIRCLTQRVRLKMDLFAVFYEINNLANRPYIRIFECF